MDCRYVYRELIQRFDEGSLENLTGEMKNHLETCLECQRELQSLIQLQQGLTRLPTPDPGQSFWITFLPKLRRRMSGSASSASKGDLAWIPSLGLAFLFILLLLGSPARIAPPSWFQFETSERFYQESDVLWSDGLTEGDYEQLAEISESDDIFDLYLNESEAHFIDRLSEISAYSPSDLIDGLATMDDDALTSFFEKLKAIPIIGS